MLVVQTIGYGIQIHGDISENARDKVMSVENVIECEASRKVKSQDRHRFGQRG